MLVESGCDAHTNSNYVHILVKVAGDRIESSKNRTLGGAIASSKSYHKFVKREVSFEL